MAAVRHLGFYTFTFFAPSPLSACRSASSYKISMYLFWFLHGTLQLSDTKTRDDEKNDVIFKKLIRCIFWVNTQNLTGWKRWVLMEKLTPFDKSTKIRGYMWIWIVNKSAKFHAKRLDRSENIQTVLGWYFLKHPVYAYDCTLKACIAGFSLYFWGSKNNLLGITPTNRSRSAPDTCNTCTGFWSQVRDDFQATPQRPIFNKFSHKTWIHVPLKCTGRYLGKCSV